MAKVKIDSNLLARAKDVSEAAGYSSVEEFVGHVIEKAVAEHEAGETDDKVLERIRGLGYIE